MTYVEVPRLFRKKTISLTVRRCSVVCLDQPLRSRRVGPRDSSLPVMVVLSTLTLNLLYKLLNTKFRRIYQTQFCVLDIVIHPWSTLMTRTYFYSEADFRRAEIRISYVCSSEVILRRDKIVSNHSVKQRVHHEASFHVVCRLKRAHVTVTIATMWYLCFITVLESCVFTAHTLYSCILHKRRSKTTRLS